MHMQTCLLFNSIRFSTLLFALYTWQQLLFCCTFTGIRFVYRQWNAQGNSHILFLIRKRKQLFSSLHQSPGSQTKQTLPWGLSHLNWVQSHFFECVPLTVHCPLVYYRILRLIIFQQGIEYSDWLLLAREGMRGLIIALLRWNIDQKSGTGGPSGDLMNYLWADDDSAQQLVFALPEMNKIQYVVFVSKLSVKWE